LQRVESGEEQLCLKKGSAASVKESTSSLESRQFRLHKKISSQLMHNHFGTFVAFTETAVNEYVIAGQFSGISQLSWTASTKQ
jgi:hypothetical protein